MMKQSDDRETFGSDREAIADVLRRWIHYRDRGMWERLRTTFHPGGAISSLWFDGPFETFVDASEKMSAKTGPTKHDMGIPLIDLKGPRAVAETDVTILVRTNLMDNEFDLTSYVRFYDLLEKREGAWRLCRRTVIYEKDRLDPARPFQKEPDPSPFADPPDVHPAYRFLGGGMMARGFELMPNIVTDNSKEAALLYEEGEKWLSGP